MQSSISKYDHDLLFCIFDQTIRNVLFMSLAASSYNKEWVVSFIAEKRCKVQAASLIFSFVPQNQIGSFSGQRQHMCESSYKQIYAAMKPFAYGESLYSQYKTELRLEL